MGISMTILSRKFPIKTIAAVKCISNSRDDDLVWTSLYDVHGLLKSCRSVGSLYIHVKRVLLVYVQDIRVNAANKRLYLQF